MSSTSKAQEGPTVLKAITINPQQEAASTDSTDATDNELDFDVTPESSQVADSDDTDSLLTTSPDDEEEDDQDDDDQGVVEIYNQKCLGCGHLVAFAEKKYKSCHFTAGNEHCPASSLQIVVRIPVEKIVRSFLTAERMGDSSRLARLYAKLAAKPEWYQNRVNQVLKWARVKDAQ
jgi:hypothetical protein